MLKFVESTEKQCSETFDSIQSRLAHLKDLNNSNLALKRLIKRNMKREGRIGQLVERLGLQQSQDDDGATGGCRRGREQAYGSKVCKMPFVLAGYTPDNSSDSPCESMGLERNNMFLKVNSKTPIRAYDDQECLRYLNLNNNNQEE